MQDQDWLDAVRFAQSNFFKLIDPSDLNRVYSDREKQQLVATFLSVMMFNGEILPETKLSEVVRLLGNRW